MGSLENRLTKACRCGRNHQLECDECKLPPPIPDGWMPPENWDWDQYVEPDLEGRA